MPNVQGAHASAALTPPFFVPYEPGAQEPEQLGCPAREENVPLAQSAQAAAELAPVAGFAVPPGQGVQSVEPLAAA